MNTQQKIADILLKYTMPDALKPQYDGMTAYELGGIILREIANGKVATEDIPDKYQHLSPDDDIFDPREREAEREYEKNEANSHLHKV